MEKHPTYSKPSKVRAEEGRVEVRGPDHVEVDMTPEAAEETSDRLLHEAMKARGHRCLQDHPHKAE